MWKELLSLTKLCDLQQHCSCFVSLAFVKGDDGGVDCYACSSASPDICNDDHDHNITIPGYIPNLTSKSAFNVEALGNNSYLTCKDFLVKSLNEKKTEMKKIRFDQ